MGDAPALEYEHPVEVVRGSGGFNNSNNFPCDAVSRHSITSEVHHLRELSNDLESLYLSYEYSDVTFILDDGERVPAHRVILAPRSRIFKALLFNGMQETHNREIELKDTNSTAFKQILRYAYTSRIAFSGVDMEILLEFLSLSHRYEILKLVESIADYLKESLNIDNLCDIFNAAQLFSLQDLTEYCLSYSDRHAAQLLAAPSFINLSSDSLRQLLRRDSFYASELEIFNSVKAWSSVNPEEKTGLKSLLQLVRLPLIPQAQLLEVVRPSKLIDADDLLDAISVQTQKSGNVAFRGVRIVDTNIATVFNGSNVVCCDNDNGKKLLCEEIPEDQRTAIHYNPRQSNQFGSKLGIIIDFGKPHIINLIIMDLCSKSELQLYSYIVEISMTNDPELNWKCVADYSNYACRMRQNVFFEDSVVRYVRIRCAERIYPKLVVKRFEAIYSSEAANITIDQETGLIAPIKNVATIDNHAWVVEGVSRCRNALLNGEISNYDWDSGYTCHQIGNGGNITVQFPQPYLLSSMRILLWDCDDRFYCYYVAVSSNHTDWVTVVDKTEEHCRGWQNLYFDPIPVVFIKLVGTRNSSNEVFHVVHLEAPASPSIQSII